MHPINQAKTPQTIKPKFNHLIKFTLIIVLIGLGLTFRFTNHQNNQLKTLNKHNQLQYALIGDIGGTNIRYQLVSFYQNQKNNYTIVKQQRMKVKDYDTFQTSVNDFLTNITLSQYPNVAVIAMAGPIYLNTVALSNVPKWGRLNGTQLTTKFNISQFLFINDFQAVSYGLLIVDDEEFIQLNNKKIDQTKIRGVIGPGTGLGHSIILNNPQIEDGIIVLPSEAGHSDSPYIDEETVQYIQFLKVKYAQKYIDVEKAFCGPTIPYMLEFYSQKYQMTQTVETLTSQQIVANCMKQNPQLVYQKVYEMFMKLYSSAIANFMIQHMITGGVYLVGGLTKSLIQKIKQKDILQDWKLRHPEMLNLIDSMPIVFCNQVDLGLKGAFVMSTRLVNKARQVYVSKIEKEQVF